MPEEFLIYLRTCKICAKFGRIKLRPPTSSRRLLWRFWWQKLRIVHQIGEPHQI